MNRSLILLCVMLNGLSVMPAQTNKPVQQRAFDVIGVSARTTNLDEAGPNGAIPRLWQRLNSSNLLNQIPNRIDTDTLAVYTEYSSDENGAYTFILGAKVKPGTVAPEGMRAVHVPAASYLIFQTPRGPVEKVVPEEWQVIWHGFPSGNPLARAFTSDFELYGKAATDPKSAQVEIYIAVK